MRLTIKFILLISLLAGSVINLVEDAQAKSQAPGLQVAYVGKHAINWPIFILSSRRQEFVDTNLDLEFIRFQNFTDARDALASGSIQIWAGAPMEFVVRSIAVGKPIIIGGGYMNKAPYHLVAHGSIRYLHELEGKKIGVSNSMLVQERAMLTQLGRQGLNYRKDFGLYPAQGGSVGKLYGVAAKLFDAAYIYSETLYILGNRESGLFNTDYDFHVLNKDADFLTFPFSVIALNAKYARTKTVSELIHRFLGIMSLSVKWLYARDNRREALQIFMKHAGVSESIARAVYHDFVGKKVFAEEGAVFCDGIFKISKIIFKRSKREWRGKNTIDNILSNRTNCAK